MDTPRSTFVSVLAWIVIVLAGFATLISILQVIMFNRFFRDEMRATMQEGVQAHAMPWFAQLMLGNLELIVVLSVVGSAVSLIVAVGVLKRKNWARLVFVGLMIVGILWNLGGLALHSLMMSSFTPALESAPADVRERFEIMARVMFWFSVAFAVGLSALFGWIIKRFLSDDIRREFVAG